MKAKFEKKDLFGSVSDETIHWIWVLNHYSRANLKETRNPTCISESVIYND